MAKKLLHKTSRAYLIFAVLIFSVSVPVFYFTTEKLYVDDADEALLLYKEEFLKFHAQSIKETEISLWNRFNRNVNILERADLAKDTLFYSIYYDSLSAENEPYRELNSPILIEGKPYTLSARINLVEKEDLLKSIALLFVFIVILLLAGLYAINKRLSQSLWKPFYDTLQQIEKFELDKAIKPSFSETDIEEFNRLNQSIENLIEKNILVYRSQREFIENAAHELQTPLAIFQAKVDTLAQGLGLSEQQHQIVSALNDSIARLNRLNKNLLLLSKIENDVYIDKKEINLKDLIEKNIEFFIEQSQAKRISVKAEFEPNVSVVSNPALAEILTSNLFMNAIRHNTANGWVSISLANGTLRFSNTGQPKPLPSERLFSRFSKSNPSGQGTGLGLAIVKRIAELNGWAIEYSFEGNAHSFAVHWQH